MERRVRRIQVKADVLFPPGSDIRRSDERGQSMLPAPASAPADAPAPDRQEPEPMGVYVISVTARILRMHPQTLRKYERLGLVRPSRSVGMVRYYSDHDLRRLRMIKYLVEERGMNLAGVEMALEMVAHLQGMQQALEAQRESDAAAALQSHVHAVLEMLHYTEREPGIGEGPPRA